MMNFQASTSNLVIDWRAATQTQASLTRWKSSGLRVNARYPAGRFLHARGVMIGLADAVLVVHALIVLFIVGGLLAIWTGAAMRQAWVRNRAFRIVHLAAIGVVAMLAALDVPCPLTVLEDELRTGAAGTQGFIQHWVSVWMYYDLPPWVFAVAYVVFLLIVALTWFRVPPRR
ncbi:hypothetical protein LMG24235_00052 [Paraburkholderia sabiae]|nr:hypothetical protein LMG24235_00052 [Paraburkholderia sabiae]